MNETTHSTEPRITPAPALTAREPPAPAARPGLLKRLGIILVGVLGVGIIIAAAPRVKDWLKAAADQSPATEAKEVAGQWDPKDPDSLRLPADVVHKLGVQTAAVQPAGRSRRLELAGSLAPDTDFLLPVRARFGGEVIEIGQIGDRDATGRMTRFRDVRNGDVVQKGQLLVVVLSKELGEKKSELIDALLKRRLDQENLDRVAESYQKGAVPERVFHEAEFQVKADRNAIMKAERTLRSWQLTDEEIQGIYAEADRLARDLDLGHNRGQAPEALATRDQWKNWARVEVTAPFDGTVLEKNLTVGAIVDTTSTLFMVGDLSHLSAWVYAYEEDLPALQTLPRPIHWTVHFKTDPPISAYQGVIQEIRPMIDPTVHAALIKGKVNNHQGRLFSGQFITAVVDLPPAANEVVIPTAALVEDGQESVVFVQPDLAQPRYLLRSVAVVRRGRDVVHVRSVLRPRDERKGLKPLQPGEHVVTPGAIELRAALRDLQDNGKTAEKP